jgi:hypothetical protein
LVLPIFFWTNLPFHQPIFYQQLPQIKSILEPSSRQPLFTSPCHAQFAINLGVRHGFQFTRSAIKNLLPALASRQRGDQNLAREDVSRGSDLTAPRLPCWKAGRAPCSGWRHLHPAASPPWEGNLPRFGKTVPTEGTRARQNWAARRERAKSSECGRPSSVGDHRLLDAVGEGNKVGTQSNRARKEVAAIDAVVEHLNSRRGRSEPYTSRSGRHCCISWYSGLDARPHPLNEQRRGRGNHQSRDCCTEAWAPRAEAGTPIAQGAPLWDCAGVDAVLRRSGFTQPSCPGEVTRACWTSEHRLTVMWCWTAVEESTNMKYVHTKRRAARLEGRAGNADRPGEGDVQLSVWLLAMARWWIVLENLLACSWWSKWPASSKPQEKVWWI